MQPYPLIRFRAHAPGPGERFPEVTINPKLRPDLEVSEGSEEKGARILTIRDPVADRFYRVSPYEYVLLKTMDGSVTLDEAAERLKYLGYSYSKEDAAMILGKAAQAGLLLGTKYGTHQFQGQLKENQYKAAQEARATKIYFAYIPLINPDAFLDRTLWIFRLLVNRWTGWLAILLIPGAFYILITSLLGAEKEYLFFFNFDTLVYLWATIFLTKLVHEFAHAYTAKHFGLRVPQMGVAFLIFFPCLFCNTTDAWRLADRRQRLLISAAGILAEAGLALFSIYVYEITRLGIIHSLAYYTVAVSLISTVLFNANPLMKFDGYFILTDLLNRPNLATNSRNYLRYLFMNRLMGISLFSNPAYSNRDAFVYVIYGISQSLYRVTLYIGIIAGVYHRFNKTIGIVLALTALVLFVVKPVRTFLSTIYRHRKEIRLRPATAVAAVFAAALLVIPLFIPITTCSVYPCYLESDRIQKVTIPIGALIQTVKVRERQPVEKGEVLLTLDTSYLKKSLAQKQFDKEITLLKIKQDLLDDNTIARASERRVQLAQTNHEIQILKEDLYRAEEGIVAPFKGVVTALDKRVQEGYETPGGAVVGETKSIRNCVVKILIPEKDVENIAWGHVVRFMLSATDGRIFSGKISDVKAFSENDLKGSPFSSRQGGEIATEERDRFRLDAPLEAQYIASINFMNDVATPLLTTGRCSVSSVPTSIVARVYSRAMQTVNRESLF